MAVNENIVPEGGVRPTIGGGRNTATCKRISLSEGQIPVQLQVVNENIVPEDGVKPITNGGGKRVMCKRINLLGGQIPVQL